MNELIGAKLAGHFGLSAPTSALVLLEAEMVELIAGLEASKAGIVRASMGQNFGTQELLGFSTWPIDKWIPEFSFRGPGSDSVQISIKRYLSFTVDTLSTTRPRSMHLDGLMRKFGERFVSHWIEPR